MFGVFEGLGLGGLIGFRVWGFHLFRAFAGLFEFSFLRALQGFGISSLRFLFSGLRGLEG